MKSALLFSLALFVSNQSVALFSDWTLVKKSSSPDFADVTYQGNADTSESLQIVAFKRVDDLLKLEKTLLMSYEGNIEEQVHDEADSPFVVRDVRVLSPKATLPTVAIVTAIEKGKLETYHGMQFIIKPHCEKCLGRVEEVKRQFAKARFNEAGTEMFVAGRSFDLTMLNFSTPPGLFDRVFHDATTTLITFGVTAASIVLFGLKLCGGALGYTGPCGNNLAACQCGNNILR